MTEAERALATAGRLRLAAASRKASALPAAVLAAEWKAVDTERDRLAAPLETLLAKLGRAQATAVEAALGAALDALAAYLEPDEGNEEKRLPPTGEVVTVVASLFDFERWARETRSAALRPLLLALARGFLSGGLRAGVTLERPERFDTANARRALRENITLVEATSLTTRDRLVEAISNGLALDETRDEIAARVRGVMGDVSAARARLIAHTSTVSAYEAGQLEGYAEAGVKSKGWLSQRDGKVRPAHDALDGEEVEVGAAFSNGLQHPSQPNCRCSTYPVLAPDEPRRGARPKSLAEEKPRGRAWREKRDGEIKARWQELKARHKSPLAMQLVQEEWLARGESVSFRAVQRACYGG